MKSKTGNIMTEGRDTGEGSLSDLNKFSDTLRQYARHTVETRSGHFHKRKINASLSLARRQQVANLLTCANTVRCDVPEYRARGCDANELQSTGSVRTLTRVLTHEPKLGVAVRCQLVRFIIHVRVRRPEGAGCRSSCGRCAHLKHLGKRAGR